MTDTHELQEEQGRERFQSLARIAPWLAGAGFAIGHLAATSSCTIPQQGRCATCGGCVVALCSLAGWAIFKQRTGGEFYR